MLLQKPPNFELLRVREKATSLLELADELELYGPRQISEKELTKKLGSGAKPLGAYLRLGLERFGSYNQETGRSYSYRTKPEFIEKLRQRLSTPPKPVLETAKRVDRVFSPFKRAECKRTGSRIYPWWAYMKTEKLEELFLAQFGTMYRYDMEVSQPNIVLQLYERCLPNSPRLRELVYQVPTWSALVSNRQHFREKMAADIDCTIEEVKDIIQAITNGAYATSSPKNPMCQTLGTIRIGRLMAHPYYQGLRSDYKKMRRVLFPDKKVREIRGELYRAYERVEDVIMTVVEQHLEKAGIDGWFIHDCVITHQKLEPDNLMREVEQKTGFRVKFEEERIQPTTAPAQPPL